MKSAFIDAHRFEFTVTLMARALGVTHGGYYVWLKRREKDERAVARDAFDEAVQAAFDQHEARYGAPGIARKLRTAESR